RGCRKSRRPATLQCANREPSFGVPTATTCAPRRYRRTATCRAAPPKRRHRTLGSSTSRLITRAPRSRRLLEPVVVQVHELGAPAREAQADVVYTRRGFDGTVHVRPALRPVGGVHLAGPDRRTGIAAKALTAALE